MSASSFPRARNHCQTQLLLLRRQLNEYPSKMCSFPVIFATLFSIARAQAVPLGVIPNASLILMPSNMTMDGSTCHDCKCVMFTPTNNGTILSFNCVKIDSSRVTCQFFTTVAYLTTYSHQMVTNSSSIFFFRQLPPERSLQTTTKLTATSSSAVTSGTFDILSATSSLHDVAARHRIRGGKGCGDYSEGYNSLLA